MAALRSLTDERESPDMTLWRRMRARVCLVCGEPHHACLCPDEKPSYTDTDSSDQGEPWD